MPTTINADTVVGGAIVTGDASGQLDLQAAGSTKLSIASGGVTVSTGTSTQDGIILQGRAGGASSYRVTLTPATLSASRTLTLPNASGTLVTTISNSGSNIFLANTFGGF